MRQRRWYSAEKPQPGAESGKEKDSAPPTKTTDAKDDLTTAQEQQVTKQSETKKSTLWDKVKHEARHYWDGTKLFGKELKISTKLVIKVLAGNKLTRRENRQLKRTLIDLVRLVPFSLFVIIPFAELLLPFALKIYPDLLPSTYEDKATKKKKAQQLTKIRNEMSVFLRGTIKEGLELKKKKELAEKQLIEAGQSTDTVVDVESIEPSFEDAERILTQLRSGKDVSNQDMMKLVKLLENNLTLDNLSRPQLISICRYLGIKSFGTDNYLKHQIQKRMQYILADDKLISSEGVETLTIPELQSACIARGIKSAGISPGKMREDLENWLDLHLVQKVPAVFLILSRILFRDTVNADLHHDALRVTLSSLPDNLVNEVTLSLAEREGTATNKQRLEVLEEQEELMEEETEQEQLKKP
ncbi:LETM1 domain-containing protein mdm28, mitochondrial [Zancudomyces culisetae]|uniref:LETM1 domain-containing protein mdm28, mitochondrial n=1 Tax=Zancudomyces culisetae TaxID=1213189 RepID=A0A1R1PF50_ZANCU|nr:LETM1 domain-containing protein mdm28, mitochondrial [Zancudomyces culisetae]OMH83301.1 LETM1 domain-containing protein mdm28, mitochondrial [Zancudomyces culisetae]|eukprot:OMH79576.1 LETM1 domain-containing protein mdm28, mitochondrial [Zancudomyces culisetae]